MKQSFLVDVPVALIFFNRPDTFKQVFECVRKNRPSKLFLIQDGARDSKPSDVEKVAECRTIASHIDWNCEVHEDFSDVNLGCGKRIFTGLTNAFKIVDRLVIIEDDILISDSFLPFCAKLLEKYKEDRRINYISGMNHFGVYDDCPYSYFFSNAGAIWGWATWKRVWDDIDWNLDIISDPYIYKTIIRNGTPYRCTIGLADKAKQLHKEIHEGRNPSFWSFHLLFYAYLQSRINIVPKYNQISNIGLSDGVHISANYNDLPREEKALFFGKRYNIELDLIHPKVVFEDRYYNKIMDEFLSPTGWHKIKRIIEYKIILLKKKIGIKQHD